MIDATALVFDHGLFVSLAERLSRDFKKVYYHSPWEKGFPLLNDCVVGDIPNVVRVRDIWAVIDEVDVCVFPDIQHAGLQLHLESMGKKVWGSRKGDRMELSRRDFLEKLKEIGLPVMDWKWIFGLEELKEELQQRDDLFIKISRYRGSMETWHHQNWKLSEPILDELAVRFGPLKNDVPFIVCDPIHTDLEVGYDGYCIDGKFPSIGVQGYEIKDRAFIASVQKYEDLPEFVQTVNEKMAPVLGEYRYRNFWSTEIRIQGDKPYFIDPCCRCPSPATEAQLELYDNWGEIIMAGAEGTLVDPEPVAKFSAEAMIYHNGDSDKWRTVEVNPDFVRWVKLYRPCFVDGAFRIPPCEHNMDEIGAVVGIGNTIQEAVDHLHETVNSLKDQPVSIRSDALYEAVKEIRKAEEQGVEFTDQKVPSPESVMP